jgi:hypothetical protein
MAMRGALAVALALAVAVGACGDDTKSKNAYVEKVNEAQSAFVAVVDDSGTRIQGNASNAETATQLDMIRAAAAKVVLKLEAIKPPENVSTLHATLVKEARGLVTAFKKAADAYRSGDPAKILSAKVDLTNDIDRVNKQLNATIQQLNTKLH